MFTHDVIKQMYTLEGYLPNYPPHLISDEEMFEAFLPTKYFKLDTRYDEVTFDITDWKNYEDDSQPSYFKDHRKEGIIKQRPNSLSNNLPQHHQEALQRRS